MKNKTKELKKYVDKEGKSIFEQGRIQALNEVQEIIQDKIKYYKYGIDTFTKNNINNHILFLTRILNLPIYHS